MDLLDDRIHAASDRIHAMKNGLRPTRARSEAAKEESLTRRIRAYQLCRRRFSTRHHIHAMRDGYGVLLEHDRALDRRADSRGRRMNVIAHGIDPRSCRMRSRCRRMLPASCEVDPASRRAFSTVDRMHAISPAIDRR